MKLVSFTIAGRVSFGIVAGDRVIDVGRKPLWMTPGDLRSVEISGIGFLQNPIAQEAD